MSATVCRAPQTGLPRQLARLLVLLSCAVTLPAAWATNPFAQHLRERHLSGELLRKSGWAGDVPERRWTYWYAAQHLIGLAHAVTQDGCSDDAGLEQARQALTRLMQRAPQGDWWGGEAGNGDDNLDRLVLAGSFEANHLLLRCDKGLSATALQSLRAAVLRQRSAYASAGPLNRYARQYANQDAALLLALVHADRLMPDLALAGTIESLIQALMAAQRRDGAFNYIGVENDTPHYHGLIVALLARAHALAPDARLQQMLERSGGYWSSVVSSAGVVEHWSSPWWKHYWTHPDMPGIRLSRCFAPADVHLQQAEAWASRAEQGETFTFQAYAAARIDLAEGGSSVQSDRVASRATTPHWDRNLHGFRGTTAEGMTWGLVVGAGVRDTFVGAAARGHAEDAPSVIGAVELHVQRGAEDLFLSTSDDAIQWSAASQGALELRADYSPWPVTIHAPGFSAPARNGYHVSQRWTADGHRLHGQLTVSGLDAEASATARLRFSGRLATASSAGRWALDALIVKVADATGPLRLEPANVPAFSALKFVDAVYALKPLHGVAQFTVVIEPTQKALKE